MCQTACPVLINTGDLVKRLRKRGQPRPAAAGWTLAAKHWGAVTRGAAAGLTACRTCRRRSPRPSAAANRGGPRGGRHRQVPLWSRELPGGGPRRRRPAPAGEPAAVYLPACVNTMFGPADGGPGVQVQLRAALRAGRRHAAGAGGDRVAVLRHAVVVQGHPGRLRRDAGAGAAGGARGDPRRGAAGGHRRVLVHRGVPRAARRGGPAGPGAGRHAVRGRAGAARAGRATGGCRRCRCTRPARRPGCSSTPR